MRVTELEADRPAHVRGALALQVSEHADVTAEEPGPDYVRPAPLQDVARQPVRMTGWRITLRRQA
jgi:hypothetical protein